MRIFRLFPAFILVTAVSLAWTLPESPKKEPEDIISLKAAHLGVSTVASDLDVPWEILWGPDNWLWITEQGGNISRIHPATGKKVLLLTIPDVLRQRSLGLLGMVLHPDFSKHPYVYVDYTFRKSAGEVGTKLVRYIYRNNRLTAPKILLEIGGHNGHNGSRLLISRDKKLIFATGDAITITNAQNPESLNGKVLRMNLDGSVPTDNPVKGSLVWSKGHRNIQGLCFGPGGILYASEHGDAMDDELNIIAPNHNYGWPNVEGFCDTPAEKKFCDSTSVTEPIKSWTPTIAPAGLDFYNSDQIPEWKNSLILTTLKDADIRILKLDKTGKQIVSEKIYLDQAFGRIRDLCISPAGDIYISTSNRDWNPGKGFPKSGDDRILKISKIKGMSSAQIAQLIKKKSVRTQSDVTISQGEKLYGQYCASCHKEDGKGVEGNFPPLVKTDYVQDKSKLLKVLLNGLNGKLVIDSKEYDQAMPAFSFLNDRDLMDISNYVRKNFGNDYMAIPVEEVTLARNKTK